jgi:hypothetical protein
VRESDLSAAAEATRKEGKRNIFRESTQQGINKAKKKIYKKFRMRKKGKRRMKKKKILPQYFCVISQSLSHSPRREKVN